MFLTEHFDRTPFVISSHCTISSNQLQNKVLLYILIEYSVNWNLSRRYTDPFLFPPSLPDAKNSKQEAAWMVKITGNQIHPWIAFRKIELQKNKIQTRTKPKTNQIKTPTTTNQKSWRFHRVQRDVGTSNTLASLQNPTELLQVSQLRMPWKTPIVSVPTGFKSKYCTALSVYKPV